MSNIDRISRKQFLAGAGGLASMGASFLAAVKLGLLQSSDAYGATSKPQPFRSGDVRALAEQLSKSSYRAPAAPLPANLKALSYDQYRDIRFRTSESIWRGQGLSFELQLFAMGGIFNTPVDLWLVEDGAAKKLLADDRLFDFSKIPGKPPKAEEFGFAGFRVHGPINKSEYFDEYLVFQGASYFRAVGEGQGYGLSARGLAINTAQPGGEEFPIFRSFWIERPGPDDDDITIHALLDSPSITGAYRFTVNPGVTTICDVHTELFPRKALKEVGLAPLTSMFLLGANDRAGMFDFRPAVHDSDGLAILNGNGEEIWRPLRNPKTLQVSSFLDKNPKGFGLIQRDRKFSAYEDIEASYEKRPSLWIEPQGEWGEGSVQLVEIPTREEIHDNIVAFWRPAQGLADKRSHVFAYRMHWGPGVPDLSLARVLKTRIGKAWKGRGILFVVDFAKPDLPDDAAQVVADVRANTGKIANVVVQPNPHTGGLRTSFELQPLKVELSELRLVLTSANKPVTETWLYRWSGE